MAHLPLSRRIKENVSLWLSNPHNPSDNLFKILFA